MFCVYPRDAVVAVAIVVVDVADVVAVVVVAVDFAVVVVAIALDYVEPYLVLNILSPLSCSCCICFTCVHVGLLC